MTDRKSGDNIEKGHEQKFLETGTIGVLDSTKENEVFQKITDAIDYRTVGNKRAMFVIFKGIQNCIELCL